MLKVLVVEDDVLQRLFYKTLMGELGLEVACYANANAALEAYQQTFYPIIVTDRGLPGMDGLEFCRRIRALPQGRQSRILMISGHDTVEDIQTGMDAGADEYLIKPVDVERLLVRLRAYMEYIIKGDTQCRSSPDLHQETISGMRS